MGPFSFIVGTFPCFRHFSLTEDSLDYYTASGSFVSTNPVDKQYKLILGHAVGHQPLRFFQWMAGMFELFDITQYLNELSFS